MSDTNQAEQPGLFDAGGDRQQQISQPDLFSADPLLLDLELQGEYAARVMDRLINRGDGKLLEFDTVLSSDWPKETASTSQRNDLGHTHVPLKAHKELHESYLKRETDLLEEQRNQIRDHTVLYDQRKTDNRFARLPRISSRVREDTLRIAAMSYRVGISLHPGAAYFNEHLSGLMPPSGVIGEFDNGEGITVDQLGRTGVLDPQTREEWERDFLRFVRKVVSRQPHVICVPEFSLPPDRDEITRSIDQISDILGGSDAPEHCLMFTGSRHESLHNRGAILLRNEEHVSYPFWQYKNSPSRRLGENIMSRRANRLTKFRFKYHTSPPSRPNRAAHFLDVSSAICYDAYDPTIFLSLIKQQRERDNVSRLILVPAFNPSSDFVDVMRDLSFLSASMVLYVNAVHGDSVLFIGGFSIFELQNKGKNTIDALVDDKLSDFDKYLSRGIPPNPSNREGRSVNGVRRRRDALQYLKDEIERTNFEKLVRVEDCGCSPRSGRTTSYNCFHNILYYDIPHRLIHALLTFRREYFSEVDYLPESFWIRNVNRPRPPF